MPSMLRRQAGCAPRLGGAPTVSSSPPQRGGPLRSSAWRRTVWTPASNQAGIDDLRIHDLRHTAASLMISSGASIKAVQRQLGHASATMTLDLYGHLYDDDLDALADALDRKLAESPAPQCAPTAPGRAPGTSCRCRRLDQKPSRSKGFSGGSGIRTHGTPKGAQQFSRLSPSSARPSLQMCTTSKAEGIAAPSVSGLRPEPPPPPSAREGTLWCDDLRDRTGLAVLPRREWDLNLIRAANEDGNVAPKPTSSASRGAE